MEHFFKWFQSLSSLLERQSVGGHFRLVLHALRGTDKALWKRELDLASLKLAEYAGLLSDAAEKLWYDSIIKFISTLHITLSMDR
jgi:hypothetical protein